MKLKALSVYLVIALSALGNAAPAIAAPAPVVPEDPYKGSPPLNSLVCPGDCDKSTEERTATSVFTRCKFTLDQDNPVESVSCTPIEDKPKQYEVTCLCKVNLKVTRNDCDGGYFGPTCEPQLSVTDTYSHEGVRGPGPNCDDDPQGRLIYFRKWCVDKCKAKQDAKDLEGVCCPKNSDTNGDGSSGAHTHSESTATP